MKKLLLLTFISIFSLTLNAQNCNFTHNFTGGVLNVVDFQANINFSPNHYTFEWDFGDGHNGTGSNVTHSFNSMPPYRVCYNVVEIATSNIICTACDSITGPTSSTCNIIATQGAGLDVSFSTIQSTNSNIHWSVDGGVTWTGGNPYTHVFPHHGTFNVCMLETDINNDTLCLTCQPVVVNPVSTQCSFTASNNPSSLLDFVFFTNATAGSTVTWDFGDNTTGTGFQTGHTYTTAGTYNVCMTITDANGISCISCQTITAGSTHGNCYFTYGPWSAANTIAFTGFPAYPHSNISWDFGDGSTGTGVNVHHLFTTTGTFNVCMTETDTLGNILCTSCQPVTNHNTNNCTFNSSINPFHNLTIDFQANSGLLSTVTWDFGDGSVGTGVSASHTYTVPGTYTVCATIQSGGTSCTVCNVVTVTNNNPLCRAGFIATNLGLTGYFIDMSLPSVANTTYHWDFGDGHTSSVRFPQHTFAQSGTYNVCQTIVSGNCTDTYCETLVVDTGIINPVGCQAFFAIVQLAPYQVTVVNLSNGINLNFLWDFGDGTSDTSPFPSHFYNTTGSYNLCLTVSDANGCTNTYCDTLSVDSLGNIFRATAGFTINVVSPSQLTGIGEIIKNDSYSIYPNPVSSDLNVFVKSSIAKAEKYRVLTVFGSEILSGNMNGFEGRINMQSLSAGTYLLEVTLNDGTKGYQTVVKN